MVFLAGVLLVYNPDAPAQDQQIGDWFDFFVKKNNLKDEQCMVFAHRPSGNQNNGQKFRPRESNNIYLVESFFLLGFNILTMMLL